MTNKKFDKRNLIEKFLQANKAQYTVRQLSQHLELTTTTLEYHLKCLVEENRVNVEKKLVQDRRGIEYLTKVFWA